MSSAAKVAKELEKDIGRKVSAVTVRRTLRKAGLGAIEKPKKPLLSAKIIHLIQMDAPGLGSGQGKA
ncbi:hypothetical protein G6F53_013779 [Rhizopus delemar]|nr:hypothetical protein G6F53_013779 [Rhizopus delemar]